ncbi:hypothetical protein AVEN_26659-1 [Araneus ventricosus]|uniref:Uncharacterized protein n=1 Tax=Araneus ventricosus TaxID=182803 RepID=A0A4Y2PXC8_ARAVE|nr:hypothetical protein AVEN_26659-1 [Araneus ventricosus]
MNVLRPDVHAVCIGQLISYTKCRETIIGLKYIDNRLYGTSIPWLRAPSTPSGYWAGSANQTSSHLPPQPFSKARRPRWRCQPCLPRPQRNVMSRQSRSCSHHPLRQRKQYRPTSLTPIWAKHHLRPLFGPNFVSGPYWGQTSSPTPTWAKPPLRPLLGPNLHSYPYLGQTSFPTPTWAQYIDNNGKYSTPLPPVLFQFLFNFRGK